MTKAEKAIALVLEDSTSETTLSLARGLREALVYISTQSLVRGARTSDAKRALAAIEEEFPE